MKYADPRAEARKILGALKKKARKKNLEGMVSFGINPHNTLGVSVADIRKIARTIGKNHDIALWLWNSGVHEARILATVVDEPGMVSESQMESWVRNLDSWDVCDQACMNLFDKTPFAWKKALEWSSRSGEFEKRAGFSLMASLACHEKNAANERFDGFLPVIIENSSDERNYVRKAVNWSLRQIGKRNRTLNAHAITAAEKIMKIDSPAARWIACDALRELQSEAVRKRLGIK